MVAKAWMEIGGGVLGQSSAALAPAAGSIAWYDPSVASSITGSPVSQLNDLSGNAHHLTQATSGKRPTTGSTINSLNVLSYTIANLTHLAVTFSQASPVTVFGVVKTGAGGTGQTNSQWFGDQPDGSTTSCTVAQLSSNWAYYDGTAQTSATAVNTTAHVVATVFNGVSSQMWLDGASILTGNAGSSGLAGVALGASPQTAGVHPFEGQIGEVLVYPSALSTGDRQQTEAYLKAKWGTP